MIDFKPNWDYVTFERKIFLKDNFPFAIFM